MQSNGKIILTSAIVILSVGAINAAMSKRPETPVFAGGIGVLVLGSLLDVVSPGLGRVAAALTMLAATTTIIVEGPSLFQAIQNAQKKGA